MKRLFLLSFVTFLLSAPTLPAADHSDMSYQGVLLGADKTPVVDQFFDVVFSIWSDSISGDMLWSQMKSVQTTDGRFSTMLQNPFAFLFADNAPPSEGPFFLQLQVGADTPMSPRTRLSMVFGSMVTHRVNGDILTSAGNLLIQPPDIVPPDPVQPSIEMNVDTSQSVLIMTDVRPNGDKRVETFGNLNEPGDAHFGAITFERIPSGQDPDTSYTLQDRADVTVEKFHYTEVFGPTQETRQGADNNSGFLEALSFENGDSSHAIIQAELNGATLKTFFETGDIPTEAQFGSDGDGSRIMLKAAAERAFDAVISVGPENPGTADEKIAGAMTFTSHSLDLTESFELLKIGATATGGSILLADSLGDTSIVLDGKDDTTTDPGGAGGGGRVIVRRLDDDFDIGLNTKELMATADLVQMSAESQTGAGSGGMVRIKLGSVEMIDSIGDTAVHIFSLGDAVGIKIKKGGSSCESKGAAERAFDSVVKHDPADSTKQKKVEIGATLLTGYMVMLDSVADTTIVMEGTTGGAGGGGRIVVRGGAAVEGISDEVAIGDVDGDNVADIAVDGSLAIGETPPLEKLTVIGNICATGIIGPCSDERYKEDIETIENPVETIEMLRGVDFKYRTDEFPEKDFSEIPQVGFIAQEIEKVLPSAVSKGADGFYSVDYSRLTPVLVEAVKKQQTEIQELRNQIEELRTTLTKLTEGTLLSRSSGN